MTPNFLNLYGLVSSMVWVGAMDANPHGSIRFRAVAATRQCKCKGFGPMDATTLSKSIWFGAMDVAKPFKF